MREPSGNVLSREELDAILSSFETPEAQAHSEREPATFQHSWRASPLARALRDYGDEHARGLSSIYQRPLSFNLISLESVPAGEFAASMLETDLPALLDFLPRGTQGAVLMGRTFLFGWFGMAYGGRASSKLHVPDRAYTRIEARFLRRCIEQLLSNLGAGLAMETVDRVRVGDFIEPAMLADQISPRLRVASFECSGLGDVARLRVAIPDELCADSAPRRAISAGTSRQVESQVLGVPVRLHAEIASMDIGLRAIRQLGVGDLLELETQAESEVVVRLEGKAKFHAERGRSRSRSAIRITEKL